MPAPLAGYRVLDFTRLLPGPMATSTLADLGAELIKIERPPAGDYARHIPPLQGDSSYLFNQLNRNKQSLAIDFAKPEGRAIILELVKTAHVVVESYRDGVMRQLGLDYDSLRQYNPTLIYASLTGYGSAGPWAELAAHDLNVVAISGILEQSGSSSGPPQMMNYQIADMTAAQSLTLGILTALLKRERHGEGSRLTVSMLEAAMTNAPVLLSSHNAFGQPLPRGIDGLAGGLANYNIYPTKDSRYVALAALEYKFWERFCDAIECPDLKPRHMSVGADADTLHDELTDIFLQRSMDEWAEIGVQHNCCLTPVLRLNEALTHPQVQAMKVAYTVETEAVQATQFGLPFSLQDYAVPLSPAPRLGEHTRQILEQLNIDANSQEALMNQQLILT
ncbi:MAG: CaiB/BaiF CoA transferase family protein [Bacteroidota bacterium]